MFYVDVHYFNPEGRPFVFNPYTTGPFNKRDSAEGFVRGLAPKFGFSEGVSRAEIRPADVTDQERIHELEEKLRDCKGRLAKFTLYP